MEKLKFLWVLFIFLSTFLYSKEYLIVENGKPKCKIVISSKPKKSVQLSAFELKYHIKLITGAEIPIVKDDEKVDGLKIILGENKYTEKLGLIKNLKSQEYIIKFLPDMIIILGKDKDDYDEVEYGEEKPSAYKTWPNFFDEQGTLYATYEFIEKYFGVRWFNPTDWGIFHPVKKTLKINGKDIKNQPYFIYREVYPGMTNLDFYDWSTSGLWKGMYPNANDPDYIEWENIAYKKLKEKFKGSEYIESKRGRIKLFLLRMRVGGEKRVANHSLYHYYQLYPPDKYPEIWAKGYGDKPNQLCYTSEKLIEMVSKEAEEYFKLPEEKRRWGPNVFAVEPMDNRAFCKCEKCQELIKKGKSYPYYSTGDHSEYHFYFVNEIAKRLKKTNPDKMIITAAYASHAKYPETIKLEPNIEVMFCFATNRSPFGKEYKHELELLKEWAENCKKEKRPLSLWLYYTFPKEFADGGNFYCFPGFFAHKIDEQFKLFKKYGIKGVFHCGYGQEVEAYVTYKLMLNPDENIEKLLDEYFSCLYGNAKEEMKQIYLAIENAYIDEKNHPEGVSYSIASWKYCGTEEVMKKIRSLIEKAKSKVENEKEINNIKLFEYGILRYMEKGYNTYQELISLPFIEIKVPKVEKIDDIKGIDWSKAEKLGPWYERGSKDLSERKIEGEILHDEDNIYLKLIDYCDTENLQCSSMVFPYDDWEIFVAKSRGIPYRQIAFNPNGLIVLLSHGEINFRKNVEIKEHNIEVLPILEKDRWISIVKIPLKDISIDGVKKVEKFYMNIVRVSSGKINKKGKIGIETLVPYSSVHQLERLAEVRLEN